MALHLQNTLTRTKEAFQPIEPGKVRMYVCGPTVYDEPHIGHLRSAFTFEVMRRWLERSGYDVRFVRNVTDVDDKIIEKARMSGASDLVKATEDVAETYLKLYHDDVAALGVTPPTAEPRATQYIPHMIAFIGGLISKGAAYAANDGVYFSVKSSPSYGKLSHQDTEAILQNVRIEKNESKRDPLDFALWKASKAGEPSWPSPWGAGRPGWHIECSAMTLECLGETFDVHGGGRDLIFPHHENEVAQSEAYTGKPFARHWVHHGLITVNELKMSKSLKNYVTLKEVRGKGPTAVEELKFLFLGTHYSAPLDFNFEKMAMERSIRNRFVNFLMEVEGGANGALPADGQEALAPFRTAFASAMDDDFNTSLAITVMHELVNHVRQSPIASMRQGAARLIREFGDVLGLSFRDARPEDELADVRASIEPLLKKREEARKNKDYSEADVLRAAVDGILMNKGYKLVDEKGGAWRLVKA